MKRQTLVYLLILIVAAGGLWAVLRLGARLDAAADLGGDWTFDSGPLGPEADGPERLGKGFHIDQSGRFIRVRFDNGQQLDLRAQQLPQGAIGGSPAPVELSDSRWQMSGAVRRENGKLIGVFTLKGPERARFIAYRIPLETDKTSAAAPNRPAPRPSADVSAPPSQAAPAATPTAPVVALADEKPADGAKGAPAQVGPAVAPRDGRPIKAMQRSVEPPPHP